MRLYKLLKDLPTVKAGAIFKEKIKIDGARVLKACESGHRHSILVREIDNFDEWFELTSSISWNLKWNDRYWYIDYWGKNSWLAKKYGKLDKDTWRETLSKGLSECLRVVKPGCVVAMKWSERDIKTTELLKTLPQKPAFGDKSGMTRWLFFVKGVEDA